MRPFRLALLPALVAQFLYGSAMAADTLPLRPSGTLSPAGAGKGGPIHFEADRLDGTQGQHLEAEGKVKMRNADGQVDGDWVRYNQADDEVLARGHVAYSRDSYRIEGENLRLKLAPRLGEMQAVRYAFIRKQVPETHSQRLVFADPNQLDRIERDIPGRGQADTLHFNGPDRYKLDEATYTTCPVEDEDWVLRSKNLELDYTRNLGIARHMRLEYLDVPILYAPWLDFALDNSRKTGFLTPSAGASDERGLEIIAPWYWNIAPNRDATIIPRVMSRRGLQLGGEFRYLEQDYRGDMNMEFLPNDAISGDNRYRAQLKHQQRFTPRLSGSLDLEGVSDDRYFAELSSLVNDTSKVNLPREGMLTYNGDGWNALSRVQTFQTLQDPAKPVAEPYHRVPQLLFGVNRPHLGGGPFRFDLASEFVRFENSSGNKAEGNRFYAYPSVSLPLASSYAFLTPKLGWHYSQYDLDRNPDPLNAGTAMDTTLSRGLPIFSVDSGLYLEREGTWFGRRFIQTLEPRLYYVNIPNRDQSQFPVFDSGLADLSLGQLFTENQFIGNDRVNDANQITLAVTSRFMEADNGLERMQATLGQRYYFNDQQVTLPGGKPRGRDITDLLAQLSGQLTDRWRVATGIQYNPDDGETARANAGIHYGAGPGRVVNANLRYINDRYTSSADQGLHQLDVSWQWPLKRQWYSVGRVNYSFKDERVLEGLLGFEYNAGCWSLRGVVQQLATASSEKTNAFYLQLELRGLTKLGFDPLDVLKRSITGYTKSDEFDLP